MENEYLEKINNFFYNNCAFEDNSFGCFSKMYSMTTENIYGFLSKFDLKDKKVLTVTGSGDQLLNAYLLGAKEVTCFDINPNSFCNTKLKVTAIKHLFFHDFLAFFKIFNVNYNSIYSTFDYRIFEKLKPFLDKDTIQLYTLFYNSIGGNIYDYVYHDYDDSLFKLEKINGYINPTGYYELANILGNTDTRFIRSNLTDLKDKIKDEKFDIILLSNISDYINEMYDSDYLKNYRELIDSLSTNLNNSGIIQAGYIYSKYYGLRNYVPFLDEVERNKYFNDECFENVLVDSYESCSYPLHKKDYDQVIVYKKR